MKYEICYANCDNEVFEVDSKEELLEDVKNFIEDYSKSEYGIKFGSIRITLDKN